MLLLHSFALSCFCCCRLFCPWSSCRPTGGNNVQFKVLMRAPLLRPRSRLPLCSVLKVKLTCLPDQPRGGGEEKWEVCTTMDQERATADEDQERSWFRCETDTDPAKIHTNVSPSGTSSFRTFNETVHFTEVSAARGGEWSRQK